MIADSVISNERETHIEKYRTVHHYYSNPEEESTLSITEPTYFTNHHEE